MSVRRVAAGAVLALAAVVVPGGSAAAAAVDPGAPGPYAVEQLSYRLAPLAVPDYEVPLEVEGDVALPVGAPGPRPVVLVLHGQHRTCLRRGAPDAFPPGIGWPCPPGWTAVPNHRGYRWLTRLLASQGDIAVSISANSVNAQNNEAPAVGAVERALLLRHHLRLWTGWGDRGGDPWGGRVLGAVDPTRIALVGHSRGGEGVAQAVAAARADDPWNIRGVALIAPTAFGKQVTPGVDQMVLLPYCDGDVNDLQGQGFVDARRDLTADDPSVRSAVLVLGANHNFFNTVWATDGSNPDDWVSDPGGPGGAERRTCGAQARGRLSGSEQRAAARVYIGALVRAAVDDDPDALELLNGTAPPPASVGPAVTLVSAWPGSARLLYAPTGDRAPRAARVTTRVCRGYTPAGGSDCLSEAGVPRLPHWVPMQGGGPLPAPRALELRWSVRGGVVPMPLGAAEIDLTGRSAVVLRVALAPGLGGQPFALRLGDATGRSVVIPAASAPLVDLPGPRDPDRRLALPKVWAQSMRFPLAPGELDLQRITRAALVVQAPRGRAWVLDAAAVAADARPVVDPALPSLSVARVRVRERGDRGTFRVSLGIAITGEVRRAGRIAVLVASPASAPRWRVLAVPVGSTELSVPVTVTADDRRTGPRRYSVAVVALKEAVVARYDGAVIVEDDEPAIRARPVRAAVSAREGEPLVWRFRLSRPAAEDVFLTLQPAALPRSARALDTLDLTPDQRELWVVGDRSRPVPIAESFASLDVFIPAGATEGEARMETRADGRREGPERVAWTVRAGAFGEGDPGLVPDGLVVTGVLRD